MNDPREVGLPAAGQAPAFVVTPSAISVVRRRTVRRRQRRLAITGGAMALAAIAVTSLATDVPGQYVLEQDAVPAGPAPQPEGFPFASASPSPSVEASTQPAATDAAVASAGPAAPGTRPAPLPTRSAPADPQRTSYDSSVVRRTRTTESGADDGSCATAAGWRGSGWCFPTILPGAWRSGSPVTLTVALCRTAPEAGAVTFATAQQAGWQLYRGSSRVWSSSQRPSPFLPGERQVLSTRECLRWDVDWSVSASGRALEPGEYSLRWTTGADVRDIFGSGYRDLRTITVQ